MSAYDKRDAVNILHKLYIDGKPEMQKLLEEARERLRLAEQLHDLREREGLSQKELAERAGTTRTVISRLESPGYSQHTLTTLRKVAGAMGYGVKVEFVPLEKKRRAARPASSVKEEAAVYQVARRSKRATNKRKTR